MTDGGLIVSAFVSLILSSTLAAGRIVDGTNPTNGTIPINNTLTRDPYLDFQPPFSDSLCVQILMTGMVLALVFVLFVHLIFTAPYHWPLARLNYALQLSGACALLVSLILTLVVVLHSSYAKSRQWPYMLDYVAVTVPLSNWSQTALVFWYTLQAVVSGIVNITHIQFLTLLYPSSVEARLIFFLLGPLAIASSGMEFASLLETDEAQDLGQSIQDICNSTLTLLFTAALFIWGFALNRKNAWRTDGGTAIFGAGALILAVISTVVNFVIITEEGLQWLPGLAWALILWQSFLGWWWWIGSGLGIGDVEDMLIAEQRKRDARLRRRAKKKQKVTGRNDDAPHSDDDVDGISNAFSRFSKNLRSGQYLSRRKTNIKPNEDPSDPAPETLSQVILSPAVPGPLSLQQRTPTIESSIPSASSSQATPAGMMRLMQVPLLLWRRLRHEHQTAAREQALEQIKIREESYLPSGTNAWGLGNNGLREREEAEDRLRQLDLERRRGMLLNDDDEVNEDGNPHRQRTMEQMDTGIELREMGETSSLPVQSPQRTHPQPPWAERSRSFWWWGPLRRWRLQDQTEY